MDRQRRWELEPLEPRTLLSAAVGPRAVTGPAATALTVTLTTDRSVYQAGQPVTMTLTETNNSNHVVTTGSGPSVDGFYVTAKRATVWRSNRGVQPLFIVLQTLEPGQSVTMSATWNGEESAGRPARLSGMFQVHSQVAGANVVTIKVRS